MLKTIAWLFWLAVIALLVTVGLANNDLVTLRGLPDGLANVMGINATVQVPLFLVIFLAVGVGLLIGFIWEWLREAPIRAEARRQGRQVAELKSAVSLMQTETRAADKGDDILALLDKPKS